MEQQRNYLIGERIWVRSFFYGHYLVRPAEVLSTSKNRGTGSGECYLTVRYLDDLAGKIYECVSTDWILNPDEIETKSDL